MIAWSIHEFFKIIKIDFDEVYEELRLSRTFVIDVVTPVEKHLALICNIFLVWVFYYVIIALSQGFIMT